MPPKKSLNLVAIFLALHTGRLPRIWDIVRIKNKISKKKTHSILQSRRGRRHELVSDVPGSPK